MDEIVSVICIEPRGKHLTKGKLYQAKITQFPDCYAVVNDNNEEILYRKYRFKEDPMHNINPLAREVMEIIDYLEKQTDVTLKRYWLQIDSDLDIAYFDLYAFEFGLNTTIRVQTSVPLETSKETLLELVQKLIKSKGKAIDGKFIKIINRGDK